MAVEQARALSKDSVQKKEKELTELIVKSTTQMQDVVENKLAEIKVEREKTLEKYKAQFVEIK